MGTVDIRRSTLVSPDAARLIAAVDAELTTTFPEPGATHFSLSDAQVVAGDGAFLVAYLDDVAVGCGVTRIVLETGTRLAPAIKLYEAMGYAHIPLFGEYLSSPNTSLCFGKSLA